MLQSMNRYAWVAVATVAMFIFSPRRAQDPIGAAVISIGSGIVVALVFFVIDFLWKPLRHKYVDPRIEAKKRSRHNERAKSLPEIVLQAAEGDVQRMQSLMHEGHSADAQGPRGETALMLAARNGHTEVIELLLAGGADPLLKTASGSTAEDIAKTYKNNVCASLLRTASETASSKSS